MNNYYDGISVFFVCVFFFPVAELMIKKSDFVIPFLHVSISIQNRIQTHNRFIIKRVFGTKELGRRTRILHPW